MWCQKCQADVAAVASTDNARVFCTACGTELARPVTASAPDASSEPPVGRALRDPRDLLARWAREDALDSLDYAPPAARETPERRPVLRFDGQHPGVASPSPPIIERAVAQNPLPKPAPPAAELRAQMPQQDIIVHPPHGVNAPHFLPAPVSLADKSTKWVTLAGQLFAYLGVGGLTIGTVLILMGYFGGPASYATTGWLIATAGQMLLFLGVVTLVSGGMEQTTQEVARRIDTIGERLVRIEQAAWNAQTSGPPDQSDLKK